jgi:uncharacterized protein (DUF4415 family)
MSGSKKKRPLTRKAILAAMKNPPPGGYFVWDGKDEDERPPTQAEWDAARADYRRKRGRPPGSNKVSTTIRFDADVVARFRARGRGWQSRMNAALREWLQANE